jgi:hypothetical protein
VVERVSDRRVGPGETPTLIIAGERDEIAPAQAAELPLGTFHRTSLLG